MGNIKKNFIYNAAYQVLALLIPIITTPYLSRTLGVDAIQSYPFLQLLLCQVQRYMDKD